MGCSPSRHFKRHREPQDLHLGSQLVLLEPSQKPIESSTLNGMVAAPGTLTVLLVFPKADTQCAAWQKAAEALRFSCITISSSESAVEAFMNGKHDVVVIDRRPVSGFEPDTLLQALKSLNGAAFCSFVAVTKTSSASKDLDSVLLNMKQVRDAGYNRRVSDSMTPVGCLEELYSIQLNEYTLNQRLLAFNSTFTALQYVQDAVEITNSNFQIEYVNPAYERMFGYSSPDELLGKSTFSALENDKSEQELSDLQTSLQKGKAWSGNVTGRRKSGGHIHLQSTLYPIKGKSDRVQHYVCIKHLIEEKISGLIENAHAKDSGALSDKSKNNRKESLVRIQSMTIEAPIKKVISLIHSAQQNSNASVSQALEKVLEILKNTDLYSAELPENDDEMTSDLVGGLMTGAMPSDRKRTPVPIYKRSNSRPSEVMREHITQVLEHHTQNIHSLSEIPEELRPYLQGDDEWNYDILELERVTNGKSMVYLAMKALQRFNVCEFLSCSEDTMLNWLQVIQNHYHADNMYHNATHGADVMQASAVFMETDRIKNIFDQMDEVASLLAALIHDLDHPGRTNPFLINSRHKLAVLYNDTSVLESHHVALAFQLTSKDERINIFKNLSHEDYKNLRQNIIDIVLATEMAKHFEHLGKFVTNIISPCVPKLDPEGESANRHSWSEEEEHEFLTKPENKTLIKRIMIKCSDVSNPCRPLKLCKEWAKRIAEEYFQQTEEEKAKGLPVVMPNFDRATCNMAHSQTSFIDFFLKEMFKYWNAFCPVSDLTDNLNDNYTYWKQQYEEDRRAEEAMREEIEESSSNNSSAS